MSKNRKKMERATQFKINFALLSVGYILLGVLRLLYPLPENTLICRILGILLLVFGIVKVAVYFSRNHAVRVFRNDLAIGILLLVGGLYIVLQPEEIAPLLPVLVGLSVVYDSILKMQYAFEMRRTVFKPWLVLMVASMVMALLGVVLILSHVLGFTAQGLVYFTSTVMILDGVVNLISLVLLMLRMRHAQKTPAKPGASPATAASAAPAPAVPTTAPAAKPPDAGAATDK